MIANYLKLAVRTLLKNKVYSFIVVSGLSIAYCACLLIYLFVVGETSYDRQSPDSQRIYRVVKDFANTDGTFLPDATTPPAMAPAIQREVSEVESVLRYFPSWGDKALVKNKEKSFYEIGISRADSNFFQFFQFDFVQGDAKSALDAPDKVVITEKIAHKYFGDGPAIGQILELGRGEGSLARVSAVIRDLPSNMHFHFDFVRPLSRRVDENWGWYNFYTYIKLKNGETINMVEPKVIEVYKRHRPQGDARYYTQALTNIHLTSKLKWELEANGDLSTVRIFIGIGLVILLIAALNFINLSIVQSLNRAKEVGIRKVSGAFGTKLISQFLFESILTSIVSMAFGLCILELTTPWVNAQFGKNFQPLTSQPGVVGLAVAASLILGVISGIYPALYLSAFRPVQVLKGVFQPSNRNLWVRKGLIVVQFSVSIALMVGALIVLRQVEFLRSKSLGFNASQVVVIQNVQDVQDKKSLKLAIRKLPQVQNAGSSNGVLGGQNWVTGIITKGSNRRILLNLTAIDYEYLPVMDIPLKSGRNFREGSDSPNDSVRKIILNERAVRDLGIIGDPIGTLVAEDGEPGKEKWMEVIGVTDNFHFSSLRSEIKPYGFYLQEDWANNLAVKITSDDITKTIGELSKAWASVASDRPFEYFFLDESLKALYEADQNFKTVFTGLTLMAIYIACSGLYAIATFFIRRRTKEIGIRKVMGASASQVAWLASSEFLIIILFSNLLAWPSAYYFIAGWLNGFAYRVDINVISFLLASITALLIAALTVSVQSVKSAMANPVDSLRNE